LVFRGFFGKHFSLLPYSKDTFFRRILQGTKQVKIAGLGLKEAAIREGKHAVELLPVSEDAVWGPAHVLDLAIIYTMVGEQDAALDQIEYLSSIPPGVSAYSAARLKIDPQFDPLRSLPRFQNLLAKHSTAE
jgi:hypothetical protein